MFYGSIIRNSAINPQYRMILLGQELPELTEEVESVIDVKHLFPLWILERSEVGNPSNHLVKFTQKYYDWLYTKSGYELSTTTFNSIGLRRLVDIDTTPVEYLKHFAYTYATGLPEEQIDDSSGNADGVRNFIKNIRLGLYQKKSTEEAYNYFFQTLFGSETEVIFYYPKTDILRLNAGRFAGWNSYITSTDPDSQDYGYNYFDTTEFSGEFIYGNMGGSVLNSHVIRDGHWFQDYSYVLKTDIEDVDPGTGLPIYYDTLQEVLHPAGMKGYYEMVAADYIPPGDNEGGFGVCEKPVIGNYFPYRLTSGDSIALCFGCGGDTGSGYTFDGPTAQAFGINTNLYGGLTGCTTGDCWATVGDGSIGTTYDMPTYAFPNWSSGITNDVDQAPFFRDIYISAFTTLCPLEDSPNFGLTGCTAQGDTNGGAC